MATKDALLDLLESNKGAYLSGEKIAQQLSVSRAAVWKAVKALQEDGYAIDAVTNKGYCLSPCTDILSAVGICKYLDTGFPPLDLTVFGEVSSTNTLIREAALSGAKGGRVIVANAQTAGRGRLGRSFFSPGGTGAYASILLRPKACPQQQAVHITTMAAVAMCEAIESVCGKKAQIKWVNDIFVEGKKVCGILTEASVGLEDSMLEYVILGVGMNIYMPAGGFPSPLCNTAGAILDAPCADAKNRLVAEFLNYFLRYYLSPEPTRYVPQYRSRCFLIGKRVKVLSGQTEKTATVLGIDEECHLLVRYDTGIEAVLYSGEVSIVP